MRLELGQIWKSMTNNKS